MAAFDIAGPAFNQDKAVDIPWAELNRSALSLP